jgi:hypothetical protein
MRIEESNIEASKRTLEKHFKLDYSNGTLDEKQRAELAKDFRAILYSLYCIESLILVDEIEIFNMLKLDCHCMDLRD